MPAEKHDQCPVPVDNRAGCPGFYHNFNAKSSNVLQLVSLRFFKICKITIASGQNLNHTVVNRLNRDSLRSSDSRGPDSALSILC